MSGPEGTAFFLRSGTGAASIGGAFLVERALWQWSLAGDTVARSTLRGMSGLGVATAIFVIGEALLQRMYYGATWAETAGAVGESVTLIVVSTGITWGVVSVGGVSGAWVGPVGVGIGVAVAAIYSGASYYWDETDARELDKRMWDARASAVTRLLDSRSTWEKLQNR